MIIKSKPIGARKIGSRAVAGLARVALKNSLGAFSFARAGVQYVLDYDGVYLELEANEEGYQGSRRVKNLYLNSGDPSNWVFLADGSSTSVESATYNGAAINVLQIDNSELESGSPYFYTAGAAEPGALLPHLFTSRFIVKRIDGSKDYVHQGRTWGNAIGSESNSFNFTPSDTEFEVISQTLQDFETHIGDTIRVNAQAAGVGSIQIAQMQFEDVTGFKQEQWSSEYVPSSSTPGIKWFTTDKTGVDRANSGTIYGQGDGVVTYGGEITESAGSAITPDGVLCEPAATNLCQGWGDASQVGIAVLDGANSNYAGAVPCTSSRDTIYLDPRSGKFVHNKTDIALNDNGAGADTITSSTTDFEAQGFRSGMAVWVYGATTGVEGPFTLSSVAADTLTIPTGSLAGSQAAGQAVHIMRCPAVGDNIIVVLNDGTSHETTVSAVTLPASYANHAALSVQLAANPASDGGYAGSNNNKPVYYWNNSTDLGISVRAGGGNVTLTYDRDNVISAGLGFLNRTGLVYKLEGVGTTTYFTVDGANGEASVDFTLSAWAKRVSGASNCAIKLQQHGGQQPFTNSSYDRVFDVEESVGTNFKLEFVVPAGNTVYMLLPQMEKTDYITSPMVCKGATASRTATVISKYWDSDKTNDFNGEFNFVPANAAIGTKQVLWSVYEDANNYYEIDLTNTTVTFTKVVGGVSHTVTKSHTPVAGTSFKVSFETSTGIGISLDINDSGSLSRDTNTDSPAISNTSSHEIGSTNGSAQCIGAIKGLEVI